MNAFKILLLFFIHSFLSITLLFAQGKYRSVHWGLDDGLSDEGHNEMLKDSNGFLWIGSSMGLNRFDGNSFKHYFPDKNKPGSIIDAVITNLIEDSLHNIWVGTANGMSRYDSKADTFMNFPASQPEYRFIIPFYSVNDQVYCIEGGWTLTTYDIHSFKKKLLAEISPPEYVGGDDESWHSFVDVKSNSIWLPKSYIEGQSEAGLFEVSLTTGKRSFYKWPCYKNISGHVHRIKDMRYDKNRNLVWISSSDGLLEFTLDDKQFHHVDALNKLEDSIGLTYPEGVDIDAQGLVWWCSWPMGPVVYNPPTESVTPVFPDSKQQRQVAYNNLYIYCDPDGMIWTSSLGIYQVMPASMPVVSYNSDTLQPHHLLNGNSVNGVAIAGQQKLWIGQGDELNIFDTRTGNFTLVSSEKDLPAFHAKQIAPVNFDSIHNKALFDLWDPDKQVNALYETDIPTRKCRPVIFKDSAGQLLEPPLGYNIFPFKDGAILFTNIFTKEISQGMFWVSTDSALARWIGPVANNNGGNIGSDNDHLLFVAGQKNRTYSLADGRLTMIKSPLDSIHWNTLFYNKKDKSYWISVDDTLIHYNFDFRIIRRYIVGGILFGDGITGISPDDRGHIWMRLLRNVLWLDTSTGKIATLTEKDGFKKHGLYGGPLSVDGELFFWGAAGMDKVSPGKLVENYPPAVAYFKSLEINQKPFSSLTGINELKEISLRYNENEISIETGIINYYAKTGSRIRYKLNELSETWQYAPANYTIRYEGLQPGNYTLVIQASNASDDFNGPEKKLSINIMPPFWQTWWFKIISGLLLIFVFYGIYRLRTASLHNQRKILEQSVTERTSQVLSQKKEIESQRDQVTLALDELKSAQKQLIQSEKMASLGELTAGIAHEIQNPLNFVNNFSEVSNELVDEMNNELTKGNIEEAKLIAGDIKQNLEKINHHGKRADAIVKGMLQHSRSSTGQKEPADINALADEYLRLSYHGLRAKDKNFNATIKTDFDDTIGTINIIPQDIGRVLLNLYNNAFYAVNEKRPLSPKGEYEPTVSVSTKKEDNKVIISVKDNGNGMPQKIVDKIFQPFFTTKPTGQGTGLGLSLSYDIIKAHGGEINVHTKEGESTAMIIQLPA